MSHALKYSPRTPAKYLDTRPNSGVRRVELPRANRPSDPCPGCEPSCARASECPARAAATKPGVYGVLVGRRFGEWLVIAELEGGYVEARCSCDRVHERMAFALVSGESTRCKQCVRDRARKVG
jgi:hypothetical protein